MFLTCAADGPIDPDDNPDYRDAQDRDDYTLSQVAEGNGHQWRQCRIQSFDVPDQTDSHAEKEKQHGVVGSSEKESGGKVTHLRGEQSVGESSRPGIDLINRPADS